MSPMPARDGGAAFLLLLALVHPLGPGLLAQAPTATPASTYLERYQEVRGLHGLPDRVAEAHGIVLQRDAARFSLDDGKLYQLSPVGGRSVAVVYLGPGTFAISPPSGVEQEQLERRLGARSYQTPFHWLVLFFTDSTMAELEHRIQFGPAQLSDDVGRRVDGSLDLFDDHDPHFFDSDVVPDLMGAFLNGEATGQFLAEIGRDDGSPLLFTQDPFYFEGIQLLGQIPRTGLGSKLLGVMTEFAPQHDQGLAFRGERRGDPKVSKYTLRVDLPQTGTGEIDFRAAATLDISAVSAVGPWIPFDLFSKLQVDSVRGEDGRQAAWFKSRNGSLLWVRLDRRLEPGESGQLEIYYGGDLMDRVIDWFFIKETAHWAPRPLDGHQHAMFDITYTSPKGFALASTGDQVDSAVPVGTMIRTHWVTAAPIEWAGFNVGVFEPQRMEAPGVPPVVVLFSDAGHSALARYFGKVAQSETGRIQLQQKNMGKVVGRDVLASLMFYQHQFGDVPIKTFYATEINDAHGEAFPGLIHLWWATFAQTSTDGSDEWFRAHEVAHQWWGIAVDFQTYHDQWLSEGFASFAALWYLQAERKTNDQYFGLLRRWRADILTHRDEPVPIWLGYRVTSMNEGENYNDIIYSKSAWVLHMLRMLLIDFKTMNEDRFTKILYDFYTNHRAGRASTEDFRQAVEQAVGADMGWFFNQWVYGERIPTWKVATRTEEAGGTYRLRLRVDQEGVPEDFTNFVLVSAELENGQSARFRVKVKGPHSEIELPVAARPKDVKFNDLESVLCDLKTVNWTN